MKNRLKGKTAIITGATAGIGEATAYQLAELGVDLILTGRRKERLEAISEYLTDKFGVNVEIAAFDIRDRSACRQFHARYAQSKIDILINNAGLASGADHVASADPSDWERMIETNVYGLIELTRLFLPAMQQTPGAHILNVSSVAGHESYPGGSVYCATKHAVAAFTRALKMETAASGLRVSLISPGAVETEFSMVRFKGDANRADAVYAGINPLTGHDIAEVIVFTLNRPDHVNIMDTLVFATAQSAATMVHRKEK